MRKIPKEYYFELAVFCMDYHSNQDSRGYRMLSKLRHEGYRCTELDIAECRESEIYNYLVETYAKSI